jgi:photosystem II stability/assembly factor-like uncharacterized protein
LGASRVNPEPGDAFGLMAFVIGVGWWLWGIICGKTRELHCHFALSEGGTRKKRVASVPSATDSEWDMVISKIRDEGGSIMSRYTSPCQRRIAKLRRYSMFLIPALIMSCLVGPQIAAGEANVWTSIGPEGEAVSALAIDPTTPTTVYAGTSGGGVFKSTDGGNSWSAANVGLTALDVRALAIDPQNPTTLYAGTYSSAGISGDTVFKSTDGGASWNRVGMFGSSEWWVSLGATTQALAIDPQNPTVLYATGTIEVFWNYGDLSRHCMVFKSSNGGGSWDVVLQSYLFYETRDFWDLAIDPQTPTTVYAGTLGLGTFKSTDGGASWITVLEPDRYGAILVIDPQTPTTPTTIYAGTSSGVVKSTDGGGSWSTVLEPAEALAIDPQTPPTPTTVYAGTSSGVVKSTDGGGSWSTILEPVVPWGVIALAIDPVTRTTLYAVTAAGLFKSTAESADVVAPDTTIGSVTDGNGAPVASGAATLSRSATFVFTGADDIAVARFECQMDATNFVACASPVTYQNLTIGSHAFEVRAIDTSGNSDGSPARHTLIIDMPPQTTIESAVDHRGRPVPNGGTASTSITFRFAGSDNNGVAGFRCRVDGAVASACTSPITYSQVVKGTHTFSVQAIDSNGFLDSTPASFTWRK